MSVIPEFSPPMDFSDRPKVAHGTRRGYELGCRCEPCVVASRVYKRRWAGQVPLDEYRAQQLASREKHGVNAYDRGCRCEVCRKANAEKCREANRAHTRKVNGTDMRDMVVCPECDTEFTRQGLGKHMRSLHGRGSDLELCYVGLPTELVNMARAIAAAEKRTLASVLRTFFIAGVMAVYKARTDT